jgi:hypothetical protein
MAVNIFIFTVPSEPGVPSAGWAAKPLQAKWGKRERERDD